LWIGGRLLFDGVTALGCASENCRRPALLSADLPAQPLYFHVLERLAGAARRDCRAGGGTADADHRAADRLCAGGVAFLAIDCVSDLDGRAAPGILVYRVLFWTALPASGVFAFARAFKCGLIP